MLNDCPIKVCMQHKATNFESIYFLEEISFLKVISLKAVIVLIFLFFASEFYEIFNCVSAKNLLIFFIAYLKKKKPPTISHSYKQRASRALCLCWQCIFLTNAAVNSSKLALRAVCFINLGFALVVLSGNIGIYEHAHLTF